MPIRKFRSVEEMPAPPFRERLDPRNLELVCALSALAFRLRPRRFPPGLHKYRSVEDASRRRVLWETQRESIADFSRQPAARRKPQAYNAGQAPMVNVPDAIVWDYREGPGDLLWRLQRIADFFPRYGIDRETVALLFANQERLRLDPATRALIAEYHRTYQGRG